MDPTENLARNPSSLLLQLNEAALAAGFSAQAFCEVAGLEHPVFERSGKSPNACKVYLSAGIHGDEPAGPLAVLQLLRSDALSRDVDWTIFPLLNPSGLQLGRRETPEGIDLNRDYGDTPASNIIASQIRLLEGRTWHLALCLHEDSDGEGFYLYGHQRDPAKLDISDFVLRATTAIMPPDLRTEIDDMPAQNGRMFPPKSIMRATRSDMPEALFLWHRCAVDHVLTTETPSSWPLEQRVAAQIAAVTAAVRALSRTKI